MRLFGRKRSRLSADTDLLTPIAGELDLGPEPQLLKHGMEVPVVFFLNEDQEPVAAAFTSERTLSDWLPEGSPYVGMQASALIPLILASEAVGLAIDLGQPDVIALTRADLEELAATFR